ncbi:MAG: hypothetical protein WC365_04270 [Candidatus Babeliales bacterium]
MSEKTYEPHVIIVYATDKTMAVKEFSYKEDAYQKYNDILQVVGVKIVLAKVVKMHGEG